MIILHVRPFLSLWIRIQSGSGSETLPVLVTFLSLLSVILKSETPTVSQTNMS